MFSCALSLAALTFRRDRAFSVFLLIMDLTCKLFIFFSLRSLELFQFNVKSLLRRAAAYEALERYRLAYVDYKTALQIDCNIAAAHDGTNRYLGICSTRSSGDCLYPLKWGCMRYISIVSGLPRVDGDCHTPSLKKWTWGPAGTLTLDGGRGKTYFRKRPKRWRTLNNIN